MFQKNSALKRLASIMLALILCVGVLQAGLFVSATASDQVEDTQTEETDEIKVSDNSVVLTDDGQEKDYKKFLDENEKIPFSNAEIVVGPSNLTASAVASELKTVEGKEAYVMDRDNKYLEYTFEVKETGLYNISLNYCPVEDTGRTIQIGVMIDGVYQYKEIENVKLSRFWVDETFENGDRYLLDVDGNEIRPKQIETFYWDEAWAKSYTGLYNDPLYVLLTEGTHTVRIERQLEAAAFSQITFKKYQEPVSYEEYTTKTSDKTIHSNTDYIIQGEDAFVKNDNKIAATLDEGNAGMTPASPTVNVVNSFGKDYWKEVGQWASWKVPDDLKPGKYVLRFRAKQNANVGVPTFRAVYINGVIPFKEASSVPFQYNNGWYMSTAGDKDGNTFLFYLEPGDVITLEATTGDLAPSLSEINQSINMLNEIYQSIIMVTGVNPDLKRDYNIQREIPTLLDDLKAAKKEISKIDKMVTEVLGDKNSKTYFFRKFIADLDEMIANYRIIVEELDSFKGNIDSYIAQTYDIRSLALEVDYIQIASPDTEEPKAGVGFWKSLKFELQRFIYSFADKYMEEDEKGRKTLTIWTTLGRDQAQAVKRLIDEDFSATHDYNIKFIISQTGLAEAILADKEPDVSLLVAQNLPINYAIRGQLLDLKPYVDQLSDEYMAQFQEAAWTPFEYDGGIYAVPTIQDFPMMYYRTDILSKLGLEPPETWDELYEVLRELQRNKFSIGIKEADSASPGVTVALGIFDMMMFQRGGTYYNEDLTQVNFESKEGKEAFVDLVKLYRDYGLDKDFDVLTRFRSGEMPIIIGGTATYQSFAAIATEIQGRWAMTTVPGIRKEDGTVDHSAVSTANGAIILKGAEERGVADEAFEFVKWWADAKTQEKYAYAMESIQGIAGRPCLANLVAFENVGWTDEEKAILNKQREFAIGVEQIPGNYIILRHFTNALRTSFNDYDDPLRQLNIQCRLINEELIRKRAEFVDNN